MGGVRFGFASGGGTTDAIFIVRQMRERCLAGRRGLWMPFVGVEGLLVGCSGRWSGGLWGGLVWRGGLQGSYNPCTLEW